MRAFEGDKAVSTVESERQTFEGAHAAALAALESMRELAEAEGILLELASVFFPNDSASPGGAPLKKQKGETSEAAEPPNLDARYQTLIEQIPAVVFMAFLDQGIGEAYVSPQIESVLGFKQEEWLNDPVR